jgi:murein L,D-transpeptidase YcbB/YkuD
MNTKLTMRVATAVSLALALSTSYAAGDDVKTRPGTSANNTQAAEPLTGKQKATAIGATTGAVAGAVVGGPIGAVVGAGIGGVVGHEGTDAKGRVTNTGNNGYHAGTHDATVRSAQAALNDQGYNVGTVDGQWGPNTQNAVRRFQAERGIAQTGTLDSATLAALGVNR